jgi:RNA-directed DNA polymerase
MSREAHVRFCERLEGQFLRATRLVVGFEHKAQAEQFLADLRQRMEQFALTLHPEKTRLIEFGRFAAPSRAKKGLGKPETFNFLGFTHICGRSARGRFVLMRKSRRDRMRAKLRAIKEALWRRMHLPIPQTGQMAGSGRPWVLQLPRGADQH